MGCHVCEELSSVLGAQVHPCGCLGVQVCMYTCVLVYRYVCTGTGCKHVCTRTHMRYTCAGISAAQMSILKFAFAMSLPCSEPPLLQGEVEIFTMGNMTLPGLAPASLLASSPQLPSLHHVT